MRPARARIDLDALRHNLALAKQWSGQARVWAVAKANAYGHGLARTRRVFDTVDGLALLDIEDAVQLRQQGWGKPLLMLEGFFEPSDLRSCAELGLTAVVHQAEQIAMMESATLARPVDVYLKINAGMNRLGFRPTEAGEALGRLRRSGKAASITLMTHFADADGARGVAEALACFEPLVAMHNLPASMANSAALLRYPQTRGDWVRPGLMLYGCSPFANEPAQALGLRPVMTVTSRIIAVQNLSPGERIGYAGITTARRPMRVGVVGFGYADGYPRHAPEGTPLLVDGRRAGTVGRVSMDMICTDITDIAGAGIGSEVTLWGEGLSADEVAVASGTVSYELLCALAARVPVEVVG